jgi:DNA-binding transcriptional LysR family regulator
LAELRAAVRAGAPFDPATTERRFVILASDLFEAYGVPLLLRSVAPEAPNLTFHIERAETDYAERLEKGTADLAFIPGFALSGSLRRLPMPKEPFVALLRASHPGAQKPLTLERYLELGHLLVAPRGLPGSLVDDALQKIHRRRRVVARVQHFAAAPFIIAETDLVLTCIALVARLAAPFPIRAVRAPVELPMDETFLAWHERAQNDLGHAWLRGRIDAVARKDRASRASTPPERARPGRRTRSALPAR